MFNKDKQLQIFEGKAPYGISTDKRITRRLLKEHRPIICKPNPISIALKYQKMYKDADYQTMEKVGQQLGVSRVRIHQMLNLLKLDQKIIYFIQNITNPWQSNFWNEHKLRNIATLPKDKQYDKFQHLVFVKSKYWPHPK